MSRYYGLVMPKIFGTGVTKVESLRQTSSSRESGGENTITQTMTDGTAASFTVLNGQGLKSTEQSESTDGNGLRSNTVRLNSSAPDLVADVAFTVKDGVGVRSHGAVSETDENNVVSKKLTIKYTDGTSDSIVFSDAKAGVAALAKSLNDERAERQTGDNTLLEKLSAEEKKRGDDDTALRTSIEEETAARTAACALLQTGMTAEESAREEANTTLQGNISTETAERKTADENLQAQISANKGAIDTLNGTGEGSVSKAVADRIAEVVSDAPGDFDTLKEISDWISGHESDASAMNSAISANTAAIAAETARAETKESEIETAVGAKADAASVYTKTDTDTMLSAKADTASVYTKEESDALLAQKADATAVPTSLSQLENDVGFITAAVENLKNYYLKSETYTREEVQNLVAAVSAPTISVVESLPESDISATTIYFLPKERSGAQNVYSEYMHINGAWELIGDTEIDLSGYYKKEDTDALLAKKQDTLTFDEAPAENSANPVTSGGVYTALSEKVTAKDIQSAIESANSKSGAGTHYLRFPSHGTTTSEVYVHVLDLNGGDEQNGICELYMGGNGNSIVDSYKLTIPSSSGNNLQMMIRADFCKHATNRGITAVYGCTTYYNAPKEIWVKIRYDRELKYYAMANTFLTGVRQWHFTETQTTPPANITTTLDLTDMQHGSKTA